MGTGLVAIVALLCAVVGPGRSAWAQAAAADEVDAATTHSQTLYRAALSAKRANDPERALCLMERARAAWPNAAFSFNIAQLQRELGLCVEARQNYQTFLEHEREPARRREAQHALAELAACEAPRNEPAPSAKENRCAAWADAALQPTPDPQVPTPPPGDTAKRTPSAGTVTISNPEPRTRTSPSAGMSASPKPSASMRSGASQSPSLDSDGHSAAPTPAQVARTDVHASSSSAPSPLMAADPPARRMPVYLPWIFAGTGALSLGLAGYELTRVASAERDVEKARDAWGPEQAAREQDGRTAQTLFWVFSGVATLTLAGALVLFLIDRDEPPTAATPQH